jgi:hypothetical protein
MVGNERRRRRVDGRVRVGLRHTDTDRGTVRVTREQQWSTGGHDDQVAVSVARLRATLPEGGPQPNLIIPDLERATLDNGLETMVMTQGELPLVQLQMVFRTGAGTDELEQLIRTLWLGSPWLRRHDDLLLFDLGVVLIENDTFAALMVLMGSDRSEAELISLWLNNSTVPKFELGQRSPDEFLGVFSEWPKSFYPGAEALLGELRHNHLACCLSNSNEIHWKDEFTQHFDCTFSSHLGIYEFEIPAASAASLGIR